MKAGSMNALIGASTSAKLADVPMRAYREAERKGNKAGMERAMGYMSELTEKAAKYSRQAQTALAEERRGEAKEQEQKLEKAAEQRKTAEKPRADEPEKAANSADGGEKPCENKIYSGGGETVSLESADPRMDVRA